MQKSCYEYSEKIVSDFGFYSKIVISTRRFKALPSAVELSARGFVPPLPLQIKRSCARPRATSAFTIACARSRESVFSPDGFPVEAV